MNKTENLLEELKEIEISKMTGEQITSIPGYSHDPSMMRRMNNIYGVGWDSNNSYQKDLTGTDTLIFILRSILEVVIFISAIILPPWIGGVIAGWAGIIVGLIIIFPLLIFIDSLQKKKKYINIKSSIGEFFRNIVEMILLISCIVLPPWIGGVIGGVSGIIIGLIFIIPLIVWLTQVIDFLDKKMKK